MKKLTPSEIKECELEILKDVASFCDKHNIHYSLTFGTLLGAIRHNGFIPWDDDIDIAIPREEYEWFVLHYKNKKYKVVDFSLDNRYPYAFAKVMDVSTKVVEQTNSDYPIGVYIDIFPVDGLPSQDRQHRKKCENMCRVALYKLVSLQYPTDVVHRLLHILIKALLYFQPHSKIINKQIALSKKYNYKDSTFATILSIRLGCKQKFKKTIFTELTKHKFEDEYFNIPIEYDKFLSRIYGDYMTPPPEDKRVAHYLKAYRIS